MRDVYGNSSNNMNKLNMSNTLSCPCATSVTAMVPIVNSRNRTVTRPGVGYTVQRDRRMLRTSHWRMG